MEINRIETAAGEVAEIVSDEVAIRTPQDALDLMVDVDAPMMVLHDHNLEPAFFDLSTRLAGEVFLKFSNYRVNLAIVGDFTKYPSQSLPALIFESNRQGQFLFVGSVDEAIRIWTRAERGAQ